MNRKTGKNTNDIKGFIIYEDMGYTAYIRYWFVHPDYRDQGIGTKLITSVFQKTQKATRYLFWVNRNNDNAMKRYLHYGFLPEDLNDNIVINRPQIQYETKNN